MKPGRRTAEEVASTKATIVKLISRKTGASIEEIGTKTDLGDRSVARYLALIGEEIVVTIVTRGDTSFYITDGTPAPKAKAPKAKAPKAKAPKAKAPKAKAPKAKAKAKAKAAPEEAA